MEVVRPDNTGAKAFLFSPGVGPLVVRPDSGDPPKVVVRVLEILGEHAHCAPTTVVG